MFILDICVVNNYTERGVTNDLIKLKISDFKLCEYGGEVEHLGRCELNTFVAVN